MLFVVLQHHSYEAAGCSNDFRAFLINDCSPAKMPVLLLLRAQMSFVWPPFGASLNLLQFAEGNDVCLEVSEQFL